MSDTALPLHKRHSRSYRENKFVYPVLSRRSKGISIGVNLNPDKICNFDCIYCQVDRRSEAVTKFVELDRLLTEIEEMLEFVTSGAIYEDESFGEVPPHLRRLNDIAFSGDGEPTTFRNFDAIAEQVAAIKARRGLDSAKIVLITNASMFHRRTCRRALEVLSGNNGEIWAKLDAGTDAYYQLVDRTKIPFQRILANVTAAAREWPLVIQTLFMRIHGEGPSAAEIEAYCDRLAEIVDAGGRLKLIQVYTVARRPAEDFVASLEPNEVDAIADRVTARTGLPVEVYYG